ncbi:hypothetical protein DE146DRAFT_12512 [Phaeosphaeria sp. MPI-PUGE-AT-0046c]|nr:hypothetical protein DE146DRAFT_12512 [Phaeosphaeria sp. MPI-PUGE-AT-0046c]
MEAYPKPRHQYIYNPRYGQRGVLTYAGQQPNGAPPTGVIPNGGMGMGVGVGMAAGGYYPGVYHPSRSLYPSHHYSGYYSGYYPGASSLYTGYSPYSSYGASPYGGYGYYNYNMYGSLYPLANFYSPYQRSYYNTVPSYGYTGGYAHVCPPGPSIATTTYHVMNGHAAPATTTHYHHATSSPAPVREDYQTENRRVAAERGAYDARPIKPADARSDDPFWCRERNGEWHLRTYYQIENECYPGRWAMDAEMGFLVFQRA